MEAKQRMVAGDVIMEQTVRSYRINDLDEALDLLIDTYGGLNVVENTVRSLVRRALQRGRTQREAAGLLGVSPRMVCYHKQRILALQTR